MLRLSSSNSHLAYGYINLNEILIIFVKPFKRLFRRVKLFAKYFIKSPEEETIFKTLEKNLQYHLNQCSSMHHGLTLTWRHMKRKTLVLYIDLKGWCKKIDSWKKFYEKKANEWYIFLFICFILWPHR